MSYFDLEAADPTNQIVSYIIELRQNGCFLPYYEYTLVHQWLTHARGDVDKLILVLSEVLPTYLKSGNSTKNRPRSLQGINRTVLSRLNELTMREANS